MLKLGHQITCCLKTM